MVLYPETVWSDVIRPVYGLICLQPIVLLWFYFHDSLHWWENYLNIGWPLNLIGTIWLIPCYAVYEKLIFPHPELTDNKNEGLL